LKTGSNLDTRGSGSLYSGSYKACVYESMRKKDYYEILGVARDADSGEIKFAYRKLALRNHPDTNSDDPRAEDRFKEINEAYDVLSHQEKREQYDLGRDFLHEGFPFRPSPYDPWSDPFEESFFSAFRCRGGGFGRGFGRRRRVFGGGFGSHRSDPEVHDLFLTSHEVLQGAERDIRLHTGRGTLVFTVSIPAGVRQGTLLHFTRPLGDGRDIDLIFRVRIAE
jgi:DnaJ-class molecular chaperone